MSMLLYELSWPCFFFCFVFFWITDFPLTVYLEYIKGRSGDSELQLEFAETLPRPNV